MKLSNAYLLSSLVVCALGGVALAQTESTPPAAPPETASISIKADGLGCTTQAGSGAFDATSWSLGAQNSVSASVSGAAGKVNVRDLQLTKAFDECSPALFLAVAVGTRLPRVTLTHAVETAGGASRTVMTVRLDDVLVSGYTLGGSPASAEPGESISLNFSRITITNTRNGATAGYDIKTNKKI